MPIKSSIVIIYLSVMTIQLGLNEIGNGHEIKASYA